jgi:AcrR family transcriptional regulator
MADIVEAKGLTKGAIYGDFVNKEAIAIAAFYKNSNNLLKKVAKHQEQSSSPLSKLFLITDFYRNYYEYNVSLDRCPILTISVDAKNQDTELLIEVQNVIHKTQNNIRKPVALAKAEGEVKETVDSEKFAKLFYARIQNAIFMSQTMQNHSYLFETTDDIDAFIKTQLKK